MHFNLYGQEIRFFAKLFIVKVELIELIPVFKSQSIVNLVPNFNIKQIKSA